MRHLLCFAFVFRVLFFCFLFELRFFVITKIIIIVSVIRRRAGFWGAVIIPNCFTVTRLPSPVFGSESVKPADLFVFCFVFVIS